MTRPGPGMSHGIYYYRADKARWIMLRSEGLHLKLGEIGDGLYLVYFYNILCPACRAFSPTWFKFVEKELQKYKSEPIKIHPIVVLCDWFASSCSSTAAANTFKEYEIKSSPTVLAALVENGQVVRRESKSGVMSMKELKKFFEEMIKVAAKVKG